MPDFDFSGPWEGFEEDNSDATPFLQEQVRLAWGGWAADGISDLGLGNPGRITATGSDTTVTVEAFTGVFRGITVTLAADADLDVEDAGGTTPSSGQTRIDRVVVRLDFAAQTAVLAVLPGTPATSGATAPALTQQDALDGVWEHELGQVRRVGNVAVTNAMISNIGQRIIAPTVYLPPGTSFVSKGARGTLIVTDTDIYVRRRTSAGTPNSLANRSILDPAWTLASLASTTWEVMSDGRAIQFRIVGGVLQITGYVRRKTGNVPTTSWSTVATIPVTSIPGVRVQDWQYSCPQPNFGDHILWQLVVPSSGNALLQVRCPTNSGLLAVSISLFQIPVGV